MGNVAPYTFTWGQSHWGNADSAWSSPGPYPLAVTIAAATTVGPVPIRVAVALAVSIAAVTSMTADSGAAVYVDVDGSGILATATTARLYDRLPAVYRDDDTAINPAVPAGDRPLLRWLASIVDRAGVGEALLDTFAPPTGSALTDPALADPTWLPWLGQLVGLSLPTPVANIPAARQAIAGALSGAQAGTDTSIIRTVQAVLSGTETVTVTDHYLGDPWKIEVATLTAETPTGLPGRTNAFVWGTATWGTAIWIEPDLIVWLLEQAGVKPAGFTLVHTQS